MKHTANYISAARIFGSLLLLFTRPLGTGFFVLYFLCGLSDVLDGFIARRYHTASKLGEKLDSAADFILTGVLLYLLYPVVAPSVYLLWWLAGIACIRLLSILVAWVRFGALGMLHTYANKATGGLLFLLPLLLAATPWGWVMPATCIVAAVSAVEELLILLSAQEYNANRKSLFFN